MSIFSQNSCSLARPLPLLGHGARQAKPRSDAAQENENNNKQSLNNHQSCRAVNRRLTVQCTILQDGIVYAFKTDFPKLTLFNRWKVVQWTARSGNLLKQKCYLECSQNLN
eukprot:scaffold197019_cov22-Tisochrysis_lutea.AAC.1